MSENVSSIINWFVFAGLIVVGFYFYKAFSVDNEEFFSESKK